MIHKNLSAILAIMQRETIRLTTAAVTMDLSSTDSPFFDNAGYTNANGIIVTGIRVTSDNKTDRTNETLTPKSTTRSGTDDILQNFIIIPLYVVIFTCCVLGNLLVILTLAQNKRMRTVTNVYLLNLAVSDLLLGVFCMPFTLVGQILRNFVFGKVMCKLIPYFQASSVSVAVWTLVAISLERYFAICRPLSSRRWQTRSHAFKMIGVVWTLSMLSNSPILIVQQLKPVSKSFDAMKCREEWSSQLSERSYVIFLDIALLFLPLITMMIAYSLIVSKLWRGLRREMKHTSCHQFYAQNQSPCKETGHLLNNAQSTFTTNNHTERSNCLLAKSSQNMPIKIKFTDNGNCNVKTEQNANISSKLTFFNKWKNQTKLVEQPLKSALKAKSSSYITTTSLTLTTSMQDIEVNKSPSLFNRQAIRSNYMDKSIEAKKKVIIMLFVIIAEFFICWVPIHILNTVYLYSPAFVYSTMSNTGISLIQLMAYISSCCNPITYCFMNRRFRSNFLSIVNNYRCCICFHTKRTSDCNESQVYSLKRIPVPCNSDASNNSNSILFAGKRSELMVLETEDRV